jgi:hypothetical protein
MVETLKRVEQLETTIPVTTLTTDASEEDVFL